MEPRGSYYKAIIIYESIYIDTLLQLKVHLGTRWRQFPQGWRMIPRNVFPHEPTGIASSGVRTNRGVQRIEE